MQNLNETTFANILYKLQYHVKWLIENFRRYKFQIKDCELLVLIHTETYNYFCRQIVSKKGTVSISSTLLVIHAFEFALILLSNRKHLLT